MKSIVFPVVSSIFLSVTPIELLAMGEESPLTARRQVEPMDNDGSQPAMGVFSHLYLPDQIFKNADRIGLTPRQREAIQKAVPGRLAELRQQQRAEAKTLEHRIKEDPINERETLRQLDRLLKIENDFKRQQLAALININKILTYEQRSQLDVLKNRESRPRPDSRAPQEPKPPQDGH